LLLFLADEGVCQQAVRQKSILGQSDRRESRHVIVIT